MMNSHAERRNYKRWSAGILPALFAAKMIAPLIPLGDHNLL